jgi:hypothetical protein
VVYTRQCVIPLGCIPSIVSTNLAIADREVEMIIALTYDLHHIRKADAKGIDIHGSRTVLTINRLTR